MTQQLIPTWQGRARHLRGRQRLFAILHP